MHLNLLILFKMYISKDIKKINWIKIFLISSSNAFQEFTFLKSLLFIDLSYEITLTLEALKNCTT